MYKNYSDAGGCDPGKSPGLASALAGAWQCRNTKSHSGVQVRRAGANSLAGQQAQLVVTGLPTLADRLLTGRNRCRQPCHGRWRSVAASRRTWFTRRCVAFLRRGCARGVTHMRLSKLLRGRSDLVHFPTRVGARCAACAAATGRHILATCAAACACDGEGATLQHCDAFQVFGAQAPGLFDQAGLLAAVAPRLSTRLSAGFPRRFHSKLRLANIHVQVDLRSRLALPARMLLPGPRRGGAIRRIGSATGRATHRARSVRTLRACRPDARRLRWNAVYTPGSKRTCRARRLTSARHAEFVNTCAVLP